MGRPRGADSDEKISGIIKVPTSSQRLWIVKKTRARKRTARKLLVNPATFMETGKYLVLKASSLPVWLPCILWLKNLNNISNCLLYTSDAADE